MSFTGVVKARYFQMVSDTLDTIHFDSIDDFTVVQQALESILDVNSEYQVPEKYQEKILFISNYLSEPESWVQNEDDFAEFKQIIKDCIELRILELASLDTEQKEAYIQNQITSRAQVAVNHEIMAQRTPPDLIAEELQLIFELLSASNQVQPELELVPDNSNEETNDDHSNSIIDLSHLSLEAGISYIRNMHQDSMSFFSSATQPEQMRRNEPNDENPSLGQ